MYTSLDLPVPANNKSGWPWSVRSEQMVSSNTAGNSWPRISVVTPSFNQGRFIEETIRSVLMQNYPNLEYMIVDGGSSDNSLNVIKRYESWISSWVSEPDNGQSDAINKGWRKASGDIIAWLNSDDLYVPGALFFIANWLVENPEIKVVYGDSLYIDESSKPIERFPAKPVNYLQMPGKPFIPQPSTFFRRDLIDQIGLLDSNYHTSMDYDLWWRIALSAKIVYVPKRLSMYRVQPNMKSRTLYSRKARELVEIHRRLNKRSDLPEDLLGQKSRLLAGAHLRAARLYFDDRKILPFFRELLLSFRHCPTNPEWHYYIKQTALKWIRKYFIKKTSERA